ncbi:MAG TPA: NAD(P)/FAD-dependent oxidoreductase [Thermoanaerobaculia bacterium]
MTYDAIIIGGGPAGLTCAIFLARYRRPVVVLDEGQPRNAPTRGIHGFLGQHGIAPRELLERGRVEAREAGAEIVDTRATKIEKNADVFEVTTARGVFCARRVVLAYGVCDTLPDIPEIESYYGLTVHHCPDCDGFECSDQRIGVIGWGKKVVGLALKLLQWSDDVVVFTHGHAREWDEEEHSKLLAERVDVVDEQIVALDGADGVVKGVVLDTGERVAVQRLFFNIKVERSCALAEELGCKVDPEKPNVIVDEHRKTTVEGVWAVGDLVEGSQLAVTAAADGAIAAIAVNKSLLPPGRQV